METITDPNQIKTPENWIQPQSFGIFKQAENTMAYLKCGIMGFAGSGKTYTGANIAIGLHKMGGENKKPVFFLDTETGSSFLVTKFKEAGVPLYVSNTRAFIALLSSVDEAEKQGAILLIDSITHFWQELQSAFKKRKGVDRLLFQHWGPIKDEWGQFTQKFVNSKCHIIMTGRAGWEYDFTENEDGGKDLVKTGTKMKADTEMGYEPSLLIEMEKIRTLGEGKVGGNFSHRAWVLKDRFDVINGKNFDDPTFEDFLPHIQRLNIGGIHDGVDVSMDSSEVFSSDRSVHERLKQRDILMEELENELSLKFNSRTDEGKKNMLNWLKETYVTTSKKAIEGMSNDVIKAGLDKLKTYTPKTTETAKETK